MLLCKLNEPIGYVCGLFLLHPMTGAVNQLHAFELRARAPHCVKAAGAQVAAVTSMGGHFCIGELLPISPLPILNGIPEVDAAVKRGKFRTIGIIGTRMVMETRLYGSISSAAVVVPPGTELDEVHENYAAMATAGRVSDAQRRVSTLS